MISQLRVFVARHGTGNGGYYRASSSNSFLRNVADAESGVKPRKIISADYISGRLHTVICRVTISRETFAAIPAIEGETWREFCYVAFGKLYLNRRIDAINADCALHAKTINGGCQA